MKQKQFDYIILGGGCAALSLANQLVNNNISKYSFLILESREKYTDDRSWCFWKEHEDSLSNLVSKSWKSFSFSFKDEKVTHISNKYHYKYIRSIDFYNRAIKKIKKSTNIDINLGEKVTKVISKKKINFVYTNKMNYITKNIIDTRPQKALFLKNPFLLQCFLGYEIEVKKYKPRFNFAKIMDNMRIENGQFFFDYLLPMGKNKYLVEITSFSKKNISFKILEILLNKTLKANNFKDYKIVRTEYGEIPMGFIEKTFKSKENNYFLAGTLGGAVRPSSGYAFLRIQKWASEFVYSLKNDKKLNSEFVEKFLIKKLDIIFLRILVKNLNIAPIIFFSFIKRISTNSFIRFMNGNPNFFDYIKIIYAMPKVTFIKTLFFSLKKNDK